MKPIARAAWLVIMFCGWCPFVRWLAFIVLLIGFACECDDLLQERRDKKGEEP